MQVLSRQGTEHLLVWLEAIHIGSLNLPLCSGAEPTTWPTSGMETHRVARLARRPLGQVGPSAQSSPSCLPLPGQPSSPRPSETQDQGLPETWELTKHK